MSNITKEFDHALRWGGSLVTDCQCGRTHFATRDDGGDYEDGELEHLRLKAKVAPENYIEDSENDSVGVAFINGVNHVWNCPCKSLERLESFLWDNRDSFTKYYRERAQRELKEAQAMVDATTGN